MSQKDVKQLVHPRPRHRPPKYNAEQVAEIAADLEKYISENEDPTIVGFTAEYTKYDINRDYIYDKREFSVLKNKAIEKQEAYLLREASKNRVNSAIAIFRLKQPQHGYKDRVEQDMTTAGQPFNFTVSRGSDS